MSIVVKSIPIALTTPTITPLLSSIVAASCRSGGRILAGSEDVFPIFLRIGKGMFVPTIKDVPIIEGFVRAGFSQMNATFNDTGVMVVSIDKPLGIDWNMRVGDTRQLSAIVTVDGDSFGVDQSVVWSIDVSSYNSYAAVSSTGLITILDGRFTEGSAIVTVRATSATNPAKFDTYRISALSRFDSIQVTPSSTTVNPGQTFTIASVLQGSGQEINLAANLVYINLRVTQNGIDTLLFGSNPSYTAGTTLGAIAIVAEYYHPSSGVTVTGTATVQNTASTGALTLVPSYTLTRFGGSNYGSAFTWSSLNDGSSSTGVAIASTIGAYCTLTVTLDAPMVVKTISIAGGYLAYNWIDDASPYLNGATLDYSTDNSNWTTYAIVSGVDDTGVTVDYNPNINARYWRLRREYEIATTAFMFYT